MQNLSVNPVPMISAVADWLSAINQAGKEPKSASINEIALLAELLVTSLETALSTNPPILGKTIGLVIEESTRKIGFVSKN